jgi:membrane protease YdiL (CAAX protease family)
MTLFQQAFLGLALAWLAAVAVRFRRSTPVLLGGLIGLGVLAAAGLATGQTSLRALGLGTPASLLQTGAFALGGLAVLLAASPVADRIASTFLKAPPNLRAFRAIQASPGRLVLGIAVAWALGGFLEELVFRGVILQAVETALHGGPVSSAVAVLAAALGAGVIHLYQGPRAAAIITQLSVLFGVVFVMSGHNLWAVILCHGLYDTVAFVRFARGKSKYSKLDAPAAD